MMKKYLHGLIISLVFSCAMSTSYGHGIDSGSGLISPPAASVSGLAPDDATYITQIPNGDLSAEQALNALSDGLLKHASGVVAQAIAGTDYINPSGISGGQTIIGGSDSGDDILFQSTSNGTKGIIGFGSLTDGLVYDETNIRLSIGGSENAITINTTSIGSRFTTHTQSGTDQLDALLHRHSGGTAFNPTIGFARSRGSEASPTAVVDGDILGSLNFYGHDGTDYEIAAQIDFEVDGTVGADQMGGAIIFSTTLDGANSVIERMRIANTGTVSIQTSNATGIVFGSLGTATRGIDMDSSGLASADDWLFLNSFNTWGADGGISATKLDLAGITNLGSIGANTWRVFVNADTAHLRLQVSTNSNVGFETSSSNSFGYSGNGISIGEFGGDGVSNGTSTITDVGGGAHGLSLATGDLAHITNSTTSADEGVYTVVSTDGTNIVLDRSLSGSDTNLAVTFFKDLIVFDQTDGTNGQRIMNYSHQDKPLQIGGDTLVATSHSLGSEDVLFGGKLEVNGTVFFDSSVTVSGQTFLNDTITGPEWWRLLTNELEIKIDTSLEQVALGVSVGVGRQLVLSDELYSQSGDFDHAVQDNPTLFIHSVTDPDSANDEWISITHDVTDPRIEWGSGSLVLDSNSADTVAIMTIENTGGNFQIFRGDASPEGVVTGSIGDEFTDTVSGGKYLKISGFATNTGWEQTGGQPSFKSYSLSNPGNAGTFYIGGYYTFAAAHEVLTIGGTVTRTFGTAGQAHGAHAFAVASGAGGTDLVLTVTGVSITDAGVKNDSDSEIIVADADTASTDDYFETTKKWLGQITYTLTGSSGAFTFNYGFVKYEDFGNRNFEVSKFEVTGEARANETGLNLELLHHEATAFTYHASAFIPNQTALVSMATDYGTNNDVASGEGFAYKRVNLNTSINGSGSEGLIIRVTTVVNNSINDLTAHIGVTLN